VRSGSRPLSCSLDVHKIPKRVSGSPLNVVVHAATVRLRVSPVYQREQHEAKLL
jgi:hypothetical protein